MSTIKKYNFDSVGDTQPTLRQHERIGLNTKKIKYGPSLPLRLSPQKGELFLMNDNLANQVADNIRNILLTNRGERVMQPNFGANLKPILSEFGSPDFENEVMARINQAVRKFMPYVSLTENAIGGITNTS